LSGGEAAVVAARDRGLVKAVGPLGLGANVVNCVVGSGIFVLPAAMAREIGTSAPLAYIACALAMGAVAICFAEGGSRAPSSGGAYGFIEAAFGPFWGYIAGVLLWISCILGVAGVAAAVADGAARIVPAVAHGVPRAAFIIVLWSILAGINIRGARAGTRLVEFATAVKLIPLAVFLVVGAVSLSADNLPMAAPHSSAGFGRAMMLAIFAFSGMETAVAVSGEVKQPSRSVPLGLLGAMGFVALLYVAIQLIAEGMLGPALGASTTPLADAMAKVSPALAGLLLAGAAISQTGYLASDVLGAPRVLFAFARDGILPPVLGRLNKTHAPQWAIIVHVAIGAALAITGSFVELAILSTVVTVGLYIMACAAAVVLQRRKVALAGQPMAFRGTPIVALIGVASMVWIAAQATRIELAGLAAVVVGFGLLYGLAMLRRGSRAA
jgi:amino acid transporter